MITSAIESDRFIPHFHCIRLLGKREVIPVSLCHRFSLAARSFDLYVTVPKYMKGFQKSYLRGLGQTLRPAIHVGKKGADEAFVRELQRVFDQQELLKVKFSARKEEKKQIAAQIAQETGATVVGVLGHNALFYRPHDEPEKRVIRLPERPEE